MLPLLHLGIICSVYCLAVHAAGAEKFQLFSELITEANNRTGDESIPLLSLGSGPPSDPTQFRFYNDKTARKQSNSSNVARDLNHFQHSVSLVFQTFHFLSGRCTPD
jgi:hypothetical protein